MARPFPWSPAPQIAALSRRPFGKKLARKVAARLSTKRGGLYNSHRDYCGHGLIYVDGKFILLRVFDGWPERKDYLASWNNEEKFIEFLARQSDFTCSGADRRATFYKKDRFTVNNQRLTRQRLRAFARSRRRRR
jgi:hypothetical protein